MLKFIYAMSSFADRDEFVQLGLFLEHEIVTYDTGQTQGIILYEQVLEISLCTWPASHTSLPRSSPDSHGICRIVIVGAQGTGQTLTSSSSHVMGVQTS